MSVTEEILVFSYGSNMLFNRIKERCQSLKVLGSGFITGHQLLFNMQSTDGSGKANAFETNNPQDKVWGTVISINKADKKLFDGFEELGSAYNEKLIDVQTKERDLRAWVYVACTDRIKDNLKPYDWYRRFVLEGAIENNLPDSYISHIKSVEFIQDEIQERRNKNFKI